MALNGDHMSGDSKTPSDHEQRFEIIRGEDLLVQLAASAEMQREDSGYYTDRRLIAWIDAEVSSPDRADEGWSGEQVRRCAERIRATAEAFRLGVRAVHGSPRSTPAVIRGTVPQILDAALASGTAPHVDLTAAAGVGRELWDETCEEWVDLPPDLPSGRYVSLRVEGESMTPLFHTGDTVLVHLGPEVKRDTVVLAWLPDGGYIIKRVGRVGRGQLQLESLNPEFAPLSVIRSERTIVGTVVLRWCPHESARAGA
jgi:SOS-response transcriptional repressor LexA